MDVDRRVLYSNAKNNYATSWNFKVEATQQLIILVRVPSSGNSGRTGKWLRSKHVRVEGRVAMVKTVYKAATRGFFC